MKWIRKYDFFVVEWINKDGSKWKFKGREYLLCSMMVWKLIDLLQKFQKLKWLNEKKTSLFEPMMAPLMKCVFFFNVFYVWFFMVIIVFY